ncbi:MAG: hypothetical protein GY950_02280, partial [bacterium]|nr:hypothetical protein [bacterium]
MNIKKLTFFLFLVICVSLGAGLTLQPQEKDETQEVFVEVINAEVIVRAVKKGKPVGGLKKSDLTLYENGKQTEITSFFEVRRKINARPTRAEQAKDPIEEKDTQEIRETRKKRLFLFYFWVSEPGSHYVETLDHFFNDVFLEGDMALLVIGEQVFKISQKDQITGVMPQIKAKLEQVSLQGKMETELIGKRVEEIFRNFELEFNKLDLSVRKDPMAARDTSDPFKKQHLRTQMVTNYKLLWDEFRYKRINKNAEKLKAIALSLKPLTFEKWGLVFFQNDVFPQLDLETLLLEKQQGFGSNLEIKKMADNLTRELNKPTSSLAVVEQVEKAFIDANATFHLLLSSPKRPTPMNSRFLKVEQVHSDWKELFSKISKATGGDVISTGKLDKSLARALAKEDIHYRLTYAPKITGKSPRIEIKTNKKRVKLIYNRKIALTGNEKVAIDDFSFKFPTLEFKLRNYRQLFDGYQMYGNIQVKITAVTTKGEIASFKRLFEPEDPEIMASLKMNFPRGGEYTLIVEALDKQSGKATVFSRKVQVPKTGLDIPVLITSTHKAEAGVDNQKGRLKTLLQKSAKYCDKLKKATFYFTCKEEIRDIYFYKGHEVKNDFHRHNYQIIVQDNGKMTEKRERIEDEPAKKKKKRKKKTKKDANDFVLTNFFSY